MVDKMNNQDDFLNKIVKVLQREMRITLFF
jgi:hypothetical protein